MPRGGRRSGAGGKFKWKSGRTRVIRIPEALADRIMEIAIALDNEIEVVIKNSTPTSKSGYDDVTASKVVNLSGISIRAFQDGPGIYLADLLKVGYEIYPEKLAQSFKVRERIKKVNRVSMVKTEIDAVIP